MAWEIEFDAGKDVVKIHYSGQVNADEIRSATQARISLQNKILCPRALVDLRRVERVNANLIEIHDLPEDHLDSLKAGRNWRLAMLLPGCSQIGSLADHYKIACGNRGWKVDCFQEEPLAFQWLGAGAN